MENIRINSKEEAIEWIHSLKTLGIKPGLARMEWMLEKLQHPERNVKFVHIAGTNGKGSTASYINQVLRKSGYKVGLFTSPYLIDFTNRIKINNEDISGEDLVTVVNKILPLAKELEQTDLGAPTEFEVVTMAALLYFGTIAYPDIVVMEAGLGGRLDSTNVIFPIVSVITNIGYDHMDLLGYDVKDIAREKAGIIKSGVYLVTAVENEEVDQVIHQVAKEKRAGVYQINKQFFIENEKIDKDGSLFDFTGPFLTMPEINIKLLGPHQVKNAATALMVLEVLRQYYAFYIDEDAYYSGMKKTSWPGRFEIMSKDPLIVIDGAHNPEGAKSLSDTISLYHNYNKLIMVTGILADKAVEAYYKHLLPMADRVIVTEPNNHRAASVDEVTDVIKGMDKDKPISSHKDIQDAVDEALNLADKNDIILFTGSLYLISDVREYLLKNISR